MGASPPIQTSLIVLQPTPFCNIDCKYCYLPTRAARDTIDLDRYPEMFAKILTFPTMGNEITIVWHGGEPLVLTPKYYDAAFSRIQRVCPAGLRVTHSFQTNGMLLNAEWFDLIEKWDVRVGLSLDGPRALHDRYRVTRSGAGSFDRAIKGLRGLRERGLPFTVLSVLTRESMRAPDDMFHFYRDHDILDLAFNVEETEGVHLSSSLTREFQEREFTAFLDRIRQLMQEHDFYIRIRELESGLTSINYAHAGPPINNLALPFGIITVAVNGDVFTFCPELAGFQSSDAKSFAIGNIYTDSYEDLRASQALARIQADIDAGIEICRASCGYFSVCGGGTPSNKFFENGTFASGETMHCRLTKKRVTDFLMSVIESKLEAPTLA